MVPVDFSEYSIEAIETAMGLANRLGSDLRLVYVQPKAGQYAKGLEEHVDLDDRPQGKLDKLIEQYKQQYAVSSGRFDYKILEGNVAEELINVAKYDKTDIIVTASHGVSGLSENWIGGNAYKVICNATCPVLVIRHGMSFDKQFRHMLITVDVNKSSRRKMPQAAGAAKLFGASVIVVGLQQTTIEWIFRRISTAVKQVVSYLKDKGVSVEATATLKGEDYQAQLFEVAKTKKADMIIVDVVNTGIFFADRFRPELTGIINSAPCPVLTIPIEYQ